jgi:lysozyme family protein
MRGSQSRRQVLWGAGVSLAALLSSRPSLAQSATGPNTLRRILDTALPPELRALLPGEVFEAADFVASLASLEEEARRIRLPASPLSLAETPLPSSVDVLYELALPRLVALIDRSELRSPAFAEKAGALLARLHRTEYVPPEQFRLSPQAATANGLRLGLAVDEPPGASADPYIPPQLDGPAPLPTEASQPAQTAPEPTPAPELSPEPPPPPSQSAEPVAPPRTSRSLRFADLVGEYEANFAAAELRPEHRQSADWHLTMLRRSRARYEAAGKRSGVPWYFIGAIHGLEASFNFRAHFHNGDYPLSQRTRQVPAGRPVVWLPPSDWESSTIDALRLLGFAGASDWSLARTLYRLEAFNGFGYRRIGRATPYLWSFSTLYDRGKFVADGRYNAAARSQQCGTGLMLKLLAEAGDITFG